MTCFLDENLPSRLQPLTPSHREILTGEGWLSRQPSAFQDAFLSLGGIRRFEPDYCLYSLDCQVSHIYGLIDGQVDVHLISSNFEEAAFPSGGRAKWYSFSDAITGDRTAGCAVVSTQSTLFCMSRTDFVSFLDKDPLRYRAVIAHDNDLRRHLQKVYMDAITGSEIERVVVRLQTLVEDERTNPNGRLKLTQRALSAICGVSLPTVQRTLRLLKNSGAVETAYGEIGIVNHKKLTEFLARIIHEGSERR